MPLRVALLDRTAGAGPLELEAALGAAGHEPELLGSRALAPAEAALARRGFTPGLSHVPAAVLRLRRGGFAVAHAFSAVDAVAALAWRALGGGPVVLTCAERLERATLADARLRLATIERAFDDSDAVIASDEEARAGVERWLARSVPVLSAGDADGHARLYADLLRARGG